MRIYECFLVGSRFLTFSMCRLLAVATCLCFSVLSPCAQILPWLSMFLFSISFLLPHFCYIWLRLCFHILQFLAQYHAARWCKCSHEMDFSVSSYLSSLLLLIYNTTQLQPIPKKRDQIAQTCETNSLTQWCHCWLQSLSCHSSSSSSTLPSHQSPDFLAASHHLLKNVVL